MNGFISGGWNPDPLNTSMAHIGKNKHRWHFDCKPTKFEWETNAVHHQMLKHVLVFHSSC